MIWIAGTALAVVFVKFGALLVLVKLLAIGLGIALLMNAVLAITLVWRSVFAKRILGKKQIEG
jgi:hypothetical protein